MKGITLDNVPMNKGRNYFFPQEVILLFEEMEKDKSLKKHLMNLKFLLWSGCRYMEATGLTNNDIFEHGFIQLRKTKVRSKIGEKKGKTKPRQKKLTQKQIKELKKYVKSQSLDNDEELFTMANSTLNRVITKIFIKMNHPFYKNLKVSGTNFIDISGKKPEYHFSCHTFRKTHLNFRVGLGEPFELMTQELGHSQKVSSEVYLSANLFNIQDKWLCNQLLYN